MTETNNIPYHPDMRTPTYWAKFLPDWMIAYFVQDIVDDRSKLDVLDQLAVMKEGYRRANA